MVYLLMTIDQEDLMAELMTVKNWMLRWFVRSHRSPTCGYSPKPLDTYPDISLNISPTRDLRLQVSWPISLKNSKDWNQP